MMQGNPCISAVARLRAPFMVVVALVLGAAQCPFPAPGQDAGPAPERAWQTVMEGPDVGGTLLSAWGSAADNVFMVGGARGNGGNSLVLRFDGSSLQRLSPGGTETYWWVSGSGADNVWMVGERGRVTRWNGTAFTELPRPADVTLWGVFTFGPDSAVVVGGTPTGGTAAPNDLVFTWDGTAWTQVALPGTARGLALFKVWGTSMTDLYVSGERGILWHRDAAGWTAESDAYNPPLASGTLFTVVGCGADDIYAVGGPSLLRRSGGAWSAVPVTEPLRNLNGVTCGGGVVTVVGFGGVKVRLRGDGTVLSNASDDEPYLDMHAAWVDPDGDVWAVGGDWVSPTRMGSPRDGLVARYSARGLPSLP